VAWGDYDNDGYLDILLIGTDSTYTPVSSVYHNNGDGTFTAIDAGLKDVANGSTAWGDYDNDGWLDILLTGNDRNWTLVAKVYHNNGDGTFADIHAGLPGVSGAGAWGDYDSDGRLDMVLTGYDNNGYPMTKVHHNGGPNPFGGWILTDINAGLTGIGGRSVAWGDYDNNGRLDILLTGRDNSDNPVSTIYHNNNDGTFTKVDAGLMGVSGGSVAWGDYNNDGLLDILLTGTYKDGSNYTPISKIYRVVGRCRIYLPLVIRH
jgi:hypothetical protein